MSKPITEGVCRDCGYPITDSEPGKAHALLRDAAQHRSHVICLSHLRIENIMLRDTMRFEARSIDSMLAHVDRMRETVKA